jgi:hypothetical protein
MLQFAPLWQPATYCFRVASIVRSGSPAEPVGVCVSVDLQVSALILQTDRTPSPPDPVGRPRSLGLTSM